MMSELQLIRASIPLQYKKAQEAIIEFKRCQNSKTLKRKEQDLKELFRLIEVELDLYCKFNSRKQEGYIR